jgi:folate-binding protein YgfZ
MGTVLGNDGAASASSAVEHSLHMSRVEQESATGATQSERALTADYELLTSGAGLTDRSQRGRLALTGAGAAEFLNGQVTNEIAALPAGGGCYAAFLTHKGKMLGDLRVLAVSDADDDSVRELLLETERVALQALFDMIRRFKIGFDVELHKRTLESSLLSLIGPESAAVAARAAGGESSLPQTAEHSHLAATIGGRAVRLISTAAPDGIDVLCDSGDRDAVEQALISAGATPASEPAAEILRIEHGRPRYGIDLDESVIPQEAGLNERAVNFTKGCYVGQETVARLFYKGKPNRHLRGVRLAQPVAAGAQLLFGDRDVGALTSSVVSPAYGPIGLALARREAEPGATLATSPAGVEATLVELPFAG